MSGITVYGEPNFQGASAELPYKGEHVLFTPQALGLDHISSVRVPELTPEPTTRPRYALLLFTQRPESGIPSQSRDFGAGTATLIGEDTPDLETWKSGEQYVRPAIAYTSPQPLVQLPPGIDLPAPVIRYAMS